MISGRYWISPTGEIVNASEHHIDDIIANPERFGFTQADVAAAYKKHGEHIGQEGDAREDLIVEALTRGWIRLRKYPKGWMWGVTVYRMTPQKRRFLKKWAKQITTVGQDGAREVDADVRIVDMSKDDGSVATTVDEILHGALEECCKTLLEEILQ